jgi:hypothetical protein
LELVHHVDNHTDVDGWVVAVQHEQVEVLQSKPVSRVDDVGPDSIFRNVGRPQLFLPVAPTLGHHNKLFPSDLSFLQ